MKKLTCPICFAYLLTHPEYRLALQNWKKCPTCGYCKQVKKQEKKNE